MNITPNLNTEELYGLNLHQYTSTTFTLPKVEDEFTIFDSLLESGTKLLKILKEEISKYKDDLKAEKSKKLHETLQTMADYTVKCVYYSQECVDSYKKRSDCMKEYKKKLQEEIKIEFSKDYYTVENFNFYGRGFGLTMIHVFENCFKVVKIYHDSKNISRKTYNDDLELHKRKLSGVEKFLNVAIIGCQLLENNPGLSPFNDGIDIYSFVISFLNSIDTTLLKHWMHFHL
jgi:hypothetical protein